LLVGVEGLELRPEAVRDGVGVIELVGEADEERVLG
jgi:hypothetical protein